MHNGLLKQVRKCTHSITILERSPEFNILEWPAHSPTRDFNAGIPRVRNSPLSLQSPETHVGLHIKCLLLLSDFYQNWNVSTKLQSIYFLNTKTLFLCNKIRYVRCVVELKLPSSIAVFWCDLAGGYHSLDNVFITPPTSFLTLKIVAVLYFDTAQVHTASQRTRPRATSSLPRREPQISVTDFGNGICMFEMMFRIVLSPGKANRMSTCRCWSSGL
jgi:hypothetical protein